jgi:hypothetical protein
MARDSGDSLPVGSRTLHKRMDERGLLRTHDRDRLTVRRALQGTKRSVLHLSSDVWGEEVGSACLPSGSSGSVEPAGTFSGHGSVESTEKRAPEKCVETAEKTPSGTECTLGTVLGDMSPAIDPHSNARGEI